MLFLSPFELPETCIQCCEKWVRNHVFRCQTSSPVAPTALHVDGAAARHCRSDSGHRSFISTGGRFSPGSHRVHATAYVHFLSLQMRIRQTFSPARHLAATSFSLPQITVPSGKCFRPSTCLRGAACWRRSSCSPPGRGSPSAAC